MVASSRLKLARYVMNKSEELLQAQREDTTGKAVQQKMVERSQSLLGAAFSNG